MFSGDVCFEFIETSCMKENGTEMSTSWRFSPKMNKCVRFAAGESCQSKNSFHSEAACAAVCPGNYPQSLFNNLIHTKSRVVLYNVN